MKTINKLLLYSLFCFGVISCNNLDLPPYNIIQDKDVFTNESGVTAYMMRLYEELPIEAFKFGKGGFNEGQPWPALANCTGEMVLCGNGLWDYPDGSWWGCWKYGSVRNANYFIENFPAYASTFSKTQSDMWLGEAYFARAYYYFAMVKRYGGVPIIKNVQNYPEQSIEELSIPRNSEYEVYKFIEEDLNKAIELLPESSVKRGRANKYVAYALKSRTMLYAASIAQFGRIQLDGLLGIPSSEKDYFYKASYDAAVALEGKYTLYNKKADKAENYIDLFLDVASPENILIKEYRYPENTHNFDIMQIPFQLRGANGFSSRFNPTLDLIEMYDDINGNPGILKITDDKGEPIRFQHTMDLFKNAEPRLKGSVILPGDNYKGESIEVYKGLYPKYASGIDPIYSENSNKLYEGVSVIGKSGMGSAEQTASGFYYRKYQDPTNTILEYSVQHWIDFRYAEILLNRAEAAFQLGKKEDALSCINLIRERAGAKLYTLEQLSEEKIRKERRLELAFENHTYWDIRRWRVADSEINNRQYYSLCPYYIYDEDKFIFKKEILPQRYTFLPKVYYERISDGEITKNKNLIQNPGY